MELFSNFCNICYRTDEIRNICEESSRHIHDILLTFVGYPPVLTNHTIYACSGCCTALESFDKFREMCFKNLIHFRQVYFEKKFKLEAANDPNVSRILEDFVNVKVFKITSNEQEESRNIAFQEVHIKKEIDYEFLDESIEEPEEQYNYLDNENSESGSNNVKIENDYQIQTEVDISEDNKYGLEKYVNNGGESSSSRHCETIVIDNEEEKKEIDRNKMFKCEFCPKAFRHKCRLTIHERTHTGNRPFPCDVCDKSFTGMSILRKHKKTHVAVKPYQCAECDMAFVRADALMRHEKIHTGERPFSCNVCDKRFIEKKNLKIHERVHLRKSLVNLLYNNGATSFK